MTIQAAKYNEETPLLIPAGTVPPEDEIERVEQGASHHDGPNQSVGATRATLIILSLWVLIFLQGTDNHV